MKGFINIIKPSNVTSAYAVAMVKKKVKLPCGHMGTLDPMASGVLPVGIDKTCRLFPYLLDKIKVYKAVFEFGYTTDTLDITGKVTENTSVIPTMQDIKAVLGNFVGEIEQMPPKYSAKCVNGKRGYQLARAGIEFELQPKKVNILKLECLNQVGENSFEFEITCTGGTYIRSLARDIGKACNSLGVMSKLERTQVGIFNIENGITLEEIANCENIEDLLTPPDECVFYPKIFLTEERATKILNGVFDNLGYDDGLYRVYNQNEFWGIGQSIDGILRIKAYVR